MNAARLAARLLPALLPIALGGVQAAPGGMPAAPGAVQRAVPMSADVEGTHRWVTDRGDNAGAHFIVIDKRRAHLWLFGPDGEPAGDTPVLLGLARGDGSVPGIGERPMAQIRPYERTTPAGRFVAEPGRNSQGEDIFWIDYDTAVSMHRVRASNAAERRLQRLATATPDDNRISYGCINVPADFYDRRIRPAFSARPGVVYVLPEDSRPSAGAPPYTVAR